MTCTFYRPETININEFENIIGKLSYDLYKLENGKYDEWNAYTYFYQLSRLAAPLENNPAMSFFGLADPKEMPSDARVDYFYRPTYLATAFMIQAVLLYSSLMNEVAFLDSDVDFTTDIVKSTLKQCLFGCTGRNFDGAGVMQIKDCIKIFEDAGADEFIEKYPDLCPEFTALYKEKKAFVASGKTDPSEMWHNHNQ